MTGINSKSLLDRESAVGVSRYSFWKYSSSPSRRENGAKTFALSRFGRVLPL